MATFSAQVVDLVGTFSDETALDSFITEGANEVINAMPRPAGASSGRNFFYKYYHF